MRWAAYVLALLAVAPAGAVAGGETGTAPNRSGTALTPHDERVLGAVLAVYVRRMKGSVGLTEQQEAQIVPEMRAAFHVRWGAAQQRRRLLLLLERANKAAEHGALLAEWADNEARLCASQQEVLQIVKRVLSPEQQLRYVLFDERFLADLARVTDETRRERVRRAFEPQRPADGAGR